jgi:hypothetical protein
MALTVRPDDEVYQFDTVWLGPDEYTLPIQARYVAWGTWLACFLVAAVVLIPLGGGGPAGVLGSLIWSLAVSVVASRAVMLVVDHERPLRSLPALFSAEARAAVQARRRADRALLVRPGKVVVREIPPKVLAMRERQRSKVARPVRPPAPEPEPVVVPSYEPAWTPDDWAEPVEQAVPVPSWSIAEADPVPVPYTPTPAPAPTPTFAYAEDHTGRHAAPEVVAAAMSRPSPFREHPAHSPTETDTVYETGPETYRGPVTVSPNGGRHARGGGRDDTPVPQHRDRQAAVEARILLPARKDR